MPIALTLATANAAPPRPSFCASAASRLAGLFKPAPPADRLAKRIGSLEVKGSRNGKTYRFKVAGRSDPGDPTVFFTIFDGDRKVGSGYRMVLPDGLMAQGAISLNPIDQGEGVAKA